jgi:GNAT superfamily N-acetyltransferase
MDARVDLATLADLPAMADLLHELFTLESDLAPDRDKQLRGLKLILDTPAIGRLFVLRVGGKVAGMANALITVSTTEGGRVVLLEDVIVGAPHRASGLGKVLLEHVFAWAKSERMTRVTLLADKDNVRALRFYQRMGFAGSGMVVRRRRL